MFRKSFFTDPRRSDVASDFVSEYNETDAASEVSWIIVGRYFVTARRVHSNEMLTKDYVVGLVDGEGSFTAYVRNQNKPHNTKRRVKIEPRFFLKLIERDKVMLDELKKYFNCGNVYFQKDSRKNHQNCYRFEVASRKDLKEIIIPFFKENCLKLPSKKKDFKIFCDLMERIEKGEHLTSKGLHNLFKIKQKMH